MKIRKFFGINSPAAQPLAPPVPQPASEEAEYAQAILQAVLQGMTGEQFAIALQMIKPDALKIASQFSAAECIAWFKHDAEAARILDTAPNFDKWASAFHKKACEIEAGL